MTTPSPPTAVAAAVSDYLVLRVSADSWQGAPKFTVRVDGKPIGGTLVATASHAKGQTQDMLLTGPFAAGAHRVEVLFDDDACGYAPGKDRNLYVHQVAFSAPSVVAPGGVTPLLSNGTSAVFETAAPALSPAASAAPASTTEDLPMTVKFLGGSGASVTNFGPAPDGKTFMGRAPAGASVTVTDGTQTGTVMASAAGIWSFVFGTAPTADVTASAVITALFKGPGGTAPIVLPPIALGVYAYNTTNSVADFYTWLGKTPAGAWGEAHGPKASQAEYESQGGWGYDLTANSWIGAGRELKVQVPSWVGYDLQTAAGGGYHNSHKLAAGFIMDALAPTQATCEARLLQEQNDDFSSFDNSWPHQIVRNGAIDPQRAAWYIAAYRDVVAAFREVAAARGKPNFFKFCWCPNFQQAYTFATSYPGDDVVDVIGMDVYYRGDTEGYATFDGYAAWDTMRTRPNGPDAIAAFAKTAANRPTVADVVPSGSKPLAFPEFAVRVDNLQLLIKAVYDWGLKNGLVRLGWWNGDTGSGYDGRVTDSNKANTVQMLRYLWGNVTTLPAVALGPNLITQPIPDLSAGWNTNGQDLIITKNYGLAPDGVTPTHRIRSASGAANLEYALSHGAGRQAGNIRALIDQTLAHYSQETGAQKHIFKTGDVHQLVQSLSGNTQFNLYSQDGAFDFEIWGAAVCSP